MDKVEEIYDIIEEFILSSKNMYSERRLEKVSLKICEALNICEYCGAKLKGERNE